MTSRISMNIDAKRVADKTALFRILDKLQPTTCGVMDGLGLANEIKQRLPNAVVWHRAFGETEAWSNGTSPNGLARLWKAQGYGDVLPHGINEPVPSGARPWGHIFNWLIVNMDAMREVGLKGVVGNIGPALFNRADLNAGVFDGYCAAWDRHADWHFRGDHEYTGILAPWGGGWGGRAPEDLLDPAKIQPDKWTRPEEITDATDNWHLQRGRWLDARSRKLGFRVPKKIVTEALWDNMPDWELRSVNVYREITRRWGNSGYPVLRGQHTLRDYYRVVFPGWTFPQALAEQLKWVERVYPPDYLGFNLYQWCTGTEWDREYGFDLATLEGMFTMLVDSQATTPPPIPAVPKPANAGPAPLRKLRTASFIRVRNAPSIGGVVAQPTNGTLLNVFYATKRKGTGDNFDWYWVEGTGFEGWQAMVYEFEYEQYLTPTTVAKTFRNPASYPHVILDGGKFNAPRDYSFNAAAKQQHEGLDFSSLHTAPRPRLVVAPADGIVEKVKSDQYYGNYVRIYHGDGWRAYYAHLEKPLVTEGQAVKEGDSIGWEGASGNVSGPHLHWTVVHIGYGQKGYVVDEVVDPLPLLRAVPIPDPEPLPIDYRALYEDERLKVATLEATVAEQQAIMIAADANIRRVMMMLFTGRADLEQIAIGLASHTERVDPIEAIAEAVEPTTEVVNGEAA
jgi:murein DD-endopeptidase MepM/ murein hydrolase activator NlpD